MENLPSKAAVIAGTGLILGWDAICPNGETYSEGIDRLIENHPILTRAVIGYTALHLCNFLPEKLDLFHHATQLKKIGKKIGEITNAG